MHHNTLTIKIKYSGNYSSLSTGHLLCLQPEAASCNGDKGPTKHQMLPLAAERNIYTYYTAKHKVCKHLSQFNRHSSVLHKYS